MDAQNRNPKDSSSSSNGRGKFPEPRAWALKWGSEEYYTVPPQTEGPSTPEPEPKMGNGEKFPQPRGWALKWDGLTMAALQDFYNPPATDTDADSPTGKS